MEGIERLEATLVFSISAIAAEHFFSAGMSSPWSVAKFAKDAKDSGQVWKLYWQGTAASVAFAVVVGAMMGDGKFVTYAVIGAVAVSAFMFWEYQQALSGSL
jgi:hypothetical protein